VPQSILVVDDEFGFLEVIGLLLTQEGFEVATASDGEDALDRLREKTPDLVITDYWMPRMDGLELCRRMSADERWRSVPVLLMTANYENEKVSSPTLVGVIAKPITFSALMSAIREVLGKKKL
jgi:CheY-like chemotaxis protein